MQNLSNVLIQICCFMPLIYQTTHSMKEGDDISVLDDLFLTNPVVSKQSTHYLK